MMELRYFMESRLRWTFFITFLNKGGNLIGFSNADKCLSDYHHKYNSYKEKNTSADPILSEETLPHDADGTTSEEEELQNKTFFNN